MSGCAGLCSASLCAHRTGGRLEPIAMSLLALQKRRKFAAKRLKFLQMHRKPARPAVFALCDRIVNVAEITSSWRGNRIGYNPVADISQAARCTFVHPRRAGMNFSSSLRRTFMLRGCRVRSGRGDRRGTRIRTPAGPIHRAINGAGSCCFDGMDVPRTIVRRHRARAGETASRADAVSLQHLGAGQCCRRRSCKEAADRTVARADRVLHRVS